MTPANPLLHDETFQQEQRRFHARLRRLQELSASGGPRGENAVSSCLKELEALLPALVQHFAREEDAIRRRRSPRPDSEQQRSEQIQSENVSHVRELRALMETGNQVSGGGETNSSTNAESLRSYIASYVGEILLHEETDCPLRAVPRGSTPQHS